MQFPGSRVVGRLIDTVLALPSFLITLAFTFLYGSAGAVNAAISGLTGRQSPALDFLYTPAGVIAAEITFFTPFVIRPLLASFALLPRAQLDVAASLGASPLRVLRTVVLPEAWPALMAGGSLVLLLTLNEFGIVLFTGAKGVITLPVLIYTRGIVTFDLPGAAVIATVQIALSLSLYALYRLVFARCSRPEPPEVADVVVGQRIAGGRSGRVRRRGGGGVRRSAGHGGVRRAGRRLESRPAVRPRAGPICGRGCRGRTWPAWRSVCRPRSSPGAWRWCWAPGPHWPRGRPRRG